MINKPKLLSEFVAICSKSGFFEAFTATEKSIKDLKFFSHAKCLQENMERAALHTAENIKNSLKVFGDQDFDAAESQLPLPEKYSLIRKRIRSTRNTPFKLADLRTNETSPLWKGFATDEQEISVELPTNSKSLSFWCFVQEKEAEEYFYRIQRQRKIWWMQYAANPGRFFISEVKSNDLTEYNQNEQSVSLKATYPFGNLAIEHIELLPTESVYPEEAGKNVIPNRIVRSSTFLELATIETVLDSIDAGDFGELCIHRRVAPYQCSVYCFGTGESQLLKPVEALYKILKHY